MQVFTIGDVKFADSYGYPQKKKKASKYPQLFVRVKFLHFLEHVTICLHQKNRFCPCLLGRKGTLLGTETVSNRNKILLEKKNTKFSWRKQNLPFYVVLVCPSQYIHLQVVDAML